MYYEEKIISGVLHWRGTPDGKWQAFDAVRLTNEVLDLRACLKAYEARMAAAIDSLNGNSERPELSGGPG